MKSSTLFFLAAACFGPAVAAPTATVAVSGAAEGFAKGVTGGGSATAVYPDTIDELTSYLADDVARVIVLTKTFDFTGSEGTTTESGCSPWGTAAACQTAINKDDWCTNYEPDAPTVKSITYDTAGVLGLTVGSNKSLLGSGATGIIKGKGIRMVAGTSNVIIQNIHFTEINPQYVWGGDAITINDADMIWIDHCTTSLIARQHIVLGTLASNRITISNHYLNGASDWSATCDGYHYWGIYLDGSSDLVTLKGNYIYKTSGRSPKVQGNTVLHAVNNYWKDNSGHAFEIGEGAYVIAEGNVFEDIAVVAEDPISGSVFTSPSADANAACTEYLGHACEVNGFTSSGTFSAATTSFFSDFSGKNVATAEAYGTVAKSVTATAGFGNL